MSLKETQVFTPRWAADQMLDILDPSVFKKEESFFFEPSCGDGAILVPMLDRIYEAVLQKHGDANRALAETLHKFFAIELDESLVTKCRINVWEWALGRVDQSTNYKTLCDYLIANQIRDSVEHNDFFVVMKESENGTIARKGKRKNLQKLQNDVPDKPVPDQHLP